MWIYDQVVMCDNMYSLESLSLSLPISFLSWLVLHVASSATQCLMNEFIPDSSAVLSISSMFSLDSFQDNRDVSYCSSCMGVSF